MRKILCAIVLALIIVPAAASASDTGDVKAAVNKLIADSNSGNDDAFKADLTEPAMFIDEYAPFHWLGVRDGWLKAYEAYNAQNGVTAGHTKPLAFRHVNVSGDHAYVVLRSLYSYRQDGKLVPEPGTEVFTLTKASGNWLVDGYAWFSRSTVATGPDATAVLSLVRDTMDGFNTGNVDPASLAWQAVIDEFPPYHWQGASAGQDWFATFGKLASAAGQTDTNVKLRTPRYLTIEAGNAYLVIPAVLTARIKGKPVREKGQFVFTLEKQVGAWRIVTLAWATD